MQDELYLSVMECSQAQIRQHFRYRKDYYFLKTSSNLGIALRIHII